MTQFEQGWWNCFTSFVNSTLYIGTAGVSSDVCIRILKEAGVKRNEAEYAIKKQYVYGEAVGVVEEYLKLEG